MTVRRIDGAAHPGRGDLEERLRAALADAEALAGALAAREEAMAILAHDLRNPLAACAGRWSRRRRVAARSAPWRGRCNEF